jgi:hypothetical protein
MTIQEQNAYLINAIGNQLKDQPNLEYTLGYMFSEWFQQKADEGLQLMQSTDQSNAAPPTEGGGGGGPNSQAQQGAPA